MLLRSVVRIRGGIAWGGSCWVASSERASWDAEHQASPQLQGDGPQRRGAGLPLRIPERSKHPACTT